jgi:hypothetical protein
MHAYAHKTSLLSKSSRKETTCIDGFVEHPRSPIHVCATGLRRGLNGFRGAGR